MTTQAQANALRLIVATLAEQDYDAWVEEMRRRYDALQNAATGPSVAHSRPRESVRLGIIEEIGAVATLRDEIGKRGPLPSPVARMVGGMLQRISQEAMSQ